MSDFSETARQLSIGVDALERIHQHGCTNFVGPKRCKDQGGRSRDSEFGATVWCDACIARDALGEIIAIPRNTAAQPLIAGDSQPEADNEEMLGTCSVHPETLHPNGSHCQCEDWGVDGPVFHPAERYRLALIDALDGMEDMVAYVPSYFREKWGHDEYIARAKKALEP